MTQRTKKLLNLIKNTIDTDKVLKQNKKLDKKLKPKM